jgi:HSP20 family protein
MSELILWKNQEMSKLRRDMDRLFSRLWSDFGMEGFADDMSEGPIEITETEDAVRVKAELKGIKPEDLDISVVRNRLTIKGKKSEKTIEKGKYYQKIERSYGSFSRSVILPSGIDIDKIKATFEKGTLDIVIPKRESEKVQGIKIEVK